MSENNLKQALIPLGAAILPNDSGTAPGIIWQPLKQIKDLPFDFKDNLPENLTILTFPGVPSEMKQMWQDTAVPFLKSQGWAKEIIYSQTLRFRGIGESALATKVASFFDLQNPTVAPYASKGEVRLRISAKAKNKIEANKLINPIAEEIKAIAGLDFFGCNEDTLASVVGELLKQKGETITVAESCTGGGLGAMLTEIAGSSDYFLGGIISYSNEIKVKQLGVCETDLQENGAVSELVAQQMALGVKKKLQSSWGISISGIAGPGGGTPEKPVGLVYIGIANPDNQVFTFRYTLGSKRGRSLIRYLSACYALDQLRRMLINVSSIKT
jgi:nicotinamide-nucleotide amidase